MAEYGLKLGNGFRAKLPERIITLVLLFILLTAAVASMTSVLIGPDWGSLWRGLFLGLLFGWTLALLQQPAWISALITLAVGTSYTLLFTGGLKEKVFSILIQLYQVFRRFASSGEYPKPESVVLGHLFQDLLRGLGVIFDRIYIWIAALVSGEAAFDPLAAALVWSIMVWAIAAWAGWVIEARRNALIAVLPAVLLSLSTLSYGRHETFALYLMLGITLLLLAIVQYEQHTRGWEAAGVAFPPRKGRQVGGMGVILAITLVIFSAVGSSFSLPRLLKWVSEQRETVPADKAGLARSLGIVAATPPHPDRFEDVRRPGLPREKLIGSGPELAQKTVMTVSVDDFLALAGRRQINPFYWRSFTYDIYTGHGWQSSSTSFSEHQANELLQPEQSRDYLLIRQTLRFSGQKANTVYAAGEPIRVDRSSETAWRSPGDLFGVQIEETAGYQVQSIIPVVDEDALRASGQRYPDWVKKHFLSLPPEIPRRVKDLAFQLTAAEPTPYDRARAIESYLRTFPYTLDVPYPPRDQDLVDYFLFDLKKGFCDYYASAMVVLARASGVPARIAVGYASGTYDLKTKRYRVSEADAHTWVEVYFPNIGWVPFEPTAGRPPLENNQSVSHPIAQNPPANQEAPAENNTVPAVVLRNILFTMLAFLFLAGIGLTVFDDLRIRRLSERKAAKEIYSRMRIYGNRLGVTPEPGITPLEFAAYLASRVNQLITPPGGHESVPIGFEPVDRMVSRIIQVSYHPNPPAVDRGSIIYSQWKTLRWQLRRMWLKQVIQSLTDLLRFHQPGRLASKLSKTV